MKGNNFSKSAEHRSAGTLLSVSKWVKFGFCVSLTSPADSQILNVYLALLQAAYHNPLDHTSGATPDPLGELHVLRHDGDPLGMNGAEHSVLKESGEVSFSRLLNS